MDFLELFGNYIFPVGMCIWMAIDARATRKEYMQQYMQLNEMHKAETDAFSEALNNNTLAIQRLTDYISKD